MHVQEEEEWQQVLAQQDTWRQPAASVSLQPHSQPGSSDGTGLAGPEPSADAAGLYAPAAVPIGMAQAGSEAQGLQGISALALAPAVDQTDTADLVSLDFVLRVTAGEHHEATLVPMSAVMGRLDCMAFKVLLMPRLVI